MDIGNDILDDLLADLDRAEATLSIRVERRRYNKPMTIISGFPEGTDLKPLAKELKRSVGAGGTVEDGTIEIQGDQGRRVQEILEREGYAVA